MIIRLRPVVCPRLQDYFGFSASDNALLPCPSGGGGGMLVCSTLEELAGSPAEACTAAGGGGGWVCGCGDGDGGFLDVSGGCGEGEGRRAGNRRQHLLGPACASW